MYNVKMEQIIESIKKVTGLSFSLGEVISMRSGVSAQRAYLNLGNMKLSFLFVELYDSSFNKNFKAIVHLSEYERVIAYSSSFSVKQINKLRSSGVGFFDDNGNYYIPMEVTSESNTPSYRKADNVRSSSFQNEFYLGFIFLKNYGLLDAPQVDIAAMLGKSTATVNVALKKMESEALIVKTERGYHLSNVENYFDRWRVLFSQFKVKNELGKFKSMISSDELKSLSVDVLNDSYWALSGPRIESLLDSGYLNNANEISIFMETKGQKALYRNLKLVPKSDGDVTLYSSQIDLRGAGQFAHEVIICAELLNSNNPRVKEAGKLIFDKYLSKTKQVKNERFGRKNI